MPTDDHILTEIRDTLKKAPALNGGFDKMTVKIDNIESKQQEMNESLAEIKTALDSPKDGIHARLLLLEKVDESVEKTFKSLKETNETFTKELKTSLSDLDNDIVHIKTELTTIKQLKKIAGENLEDLDGLVKFRKNFDKLYWLLITGVITSVIKIVFDILTIKH